MKSEYIALTHAAKEGIWLQMFINEVLDVDKGPLTISGNNQGSLVLAKDNKFHSRTKHIDLRYHFICEVVEERKIQVTYIPTKDNVVHICKNHWQNRSSPNL